MPSATLPATAFGPCSRRHALGLLSSMALCPFARGATPEPLRLGQTGMLSGPIGDLGRAMAHGASACFAAVNGQGGVGGRPIELTTLDDGYDAARALANVERLMADRSLLALFGCMGTPTVEAMMPKVLASGIPFFAPYTGALSARPKGARNVFNVRPSYPDEAERLIEHVATIGLKRIAVAYQNNAFGREIWEGARPALERRGLASVATATVETDASDAAAAAAQIVSAQPEAVLAGVAGKPTVALVKALRSQRRGLPIYALSVFGAGSTIDALGDDAIGITVSQVVPYPMGSTVLIVRDFRRDWLAAGHAPEFNHTALEGYINARIFVDVLRRIGGEITRSALIEAAWSMKHHDVGGFKVGFSEPGRSASRYIDMSMVQRGGKFLR